MARKALGRGLSGLIPQTKPKAKKGASTTEVEESSNGLIEVELSKVKTSRWQPRKHFDESKLAELADSIKAQGLVQPLIVRKSKAGKFDLIAGERRLRAVTRLDWEKVPVCVIDATDSKAREMALVENIQRDDLNAIETALAYEILSKEEKLTHEQISEHIGVSRANVTNHLRLLNLPEEIKEMVATRKLTGGHARTLLGLGDHLSQISLAKRTVNEKIPVQELEKIVRRMTNPAPTKSSAAVKVKTKNKHVEQVESVLREHLGVQVNITDKGGEGVIQIEYYSHDDIATFLEKLGLSGKL